ncbi:MAG: hypothetical protein JWR81_3019 [Pseudonocardia sp.]|jgi:hypothetical protein|nr:hypothetical protein [Pseudonocardia sp.]MDT7616891.1 hypothetical protein [Pseudonocardiales bacterium]
MIRFPEAEGCTGPGLVGARAIMTVPPCGGGQRAVVPLTGRVGER